LYLNYKLLQKLCFTLYAISLYPFGDNRPPIPLHSCHLAYFYPLVE
jgi:hypothetical protein